MGDIALDDEDIRHFFSESAAEFFQHVAIGNSTRQPHIFNSNTNSSSTATRRRSKKRSSSVDVISVSFQADCGPEILGVFGDHNGNVVYCSLQIVEASIYNHLECSIIYNNIKRP